MRVRFLVSPALLVLAAGAVSSPAQAQLVTYNDEAQFVAGVGPVPFESFENLAPRVRDSASVSVAAFTVTPDASTLGVQDSTNSPEFGFGAFATDGTHYLFDYNPNLPTGTLRFDLNHATTAFGFNITDLGETDGTLTVRTNTGEALSGITADTFPPSLGNGSLLFFGFQQATPFTQVFITVDGVDDSFGLDKVYTQAAAVPEPGVFAQAFVGVVFGGGMLLRRRRK